MFGTKMKAEADRPLKSAPVEIEENIDWQPLIDAERERLNAESGRLRAEFQVAQEEDLARFKFTATRAGSFLTISIERPHATSLLEFWRKRDAERPNDIGRWMDEPDAGAETQTLNLGATRSVVVKPGRPPLDSESAEIRCSRTGDQYSSWSYSGGDSGTTINPNGDPVATGYYAPTLKPYARFSELPSKSKPDSGANYDYRGGRHTYKGPIRPKAVTVSSLAAPAVDDEILFSGINMKISVPAGMGEKVRDLILQAMAQ